MQIKCVCYLMRWWLCLCGILSFSLVQTAVTTTRKRALRAAKKSAAVSSVRLFLARAILCAYSLKIGKDRMEYRRIMHADLFLSRPFDCSFYSLAPHCF